MWSAVCVNHGVFLFQLHVGDHGWWSSEELPLGVLREGGFQRSGGEEITGDPAEGQSSG